MYCVAYDVARYSRAFIKSGSASLAFWKSSTALSYWPSLKAATPLLRRSRALSLLQPDKPAARTTMAAAAATRLTIDCDACVIEASIPAREFSSAPEGAISPQSAGLFQLRCQQPHGQVQLPHHIHNPSNRRKLYRSIAANKSGFAGALLKNFLKPRREAVPRDRLFINFERAVFANLNNDDAFARRLHCLRFSGLG